MQQPQRPQPQERVQSSSSYSSLLRNAPPTSAARVVDIDAIELEKENIHPIRQGRSATLLTRLFSTQPGDRARELALQHQRFQEELEQIDELDDPLDVFTRYINWTIENYPQGSAQSQESHLVDLLERAIKSLKDEQRYRNDLRFVKLYILYAEIVEFPVEIYKFMEKHNIGTELSLYYEAYAEYLEAMEEMDKAGEILLLGTHRRAHPLKRLQRKYEEFRLREQHRREEQEREDMEAIAIDQASQQSHPTATHPSSANPTRRVLGDRVSASESVHPNTSALRRIPGQGSSSSRSLNTSSSQRPNNKLAVYSDTSSQSSSQATRPPNPTQRTQTPHRSEEWRDLGSDQVHRKENTQEATSWKGAKLTGENSLARRPKLEVYRDTDMTIPRDQPSQPGQLRSNQPHPTVMKAPNSVQETARTTTQQPASLPQTTRQEPSTNEAPSSTANSQSSDAFPITLNERGKQERLMINLKQVYDGGIEYCIEEIRARQPRYSCPKSLSKPSRPSMVHPPALQQQPTPAPPPQLPHVPSPSRSPPRAVAPLPISSIHPTSDSDSEWPSLGSKRRMSSSPTIHTKYASEEMNRMFSDRSRARRSLESQWITKDGRDVDSTVDYSERLSIPNLQLDSSPRAFLENGTQSEFDDDDDEQDGQTIVFLRKLEHDNGSTITQDIAAMRRKQLEEGGLEYAGQVGSSSGRLSLRSNKRGSSRFDLNHTHDMSEITIAIRQRREPAAVDVPRSSSGQGRHGGSSSSYTTESRRGSHTSARQSNGSSSSSTRPRAFKVFSDEPNSLDLENVPMLEDEAPPAYLDRDEPF